MLIKHFNISFVYLSIILLVHDSDSKPNITSERKKVEAEDSDLPIVSSYHVTSSVAFRFATVHVETYLKNGQNESAQLECSFVIPESAFISNFSMTIKGEEYLANVKEKDEAIQEFDFASSHGIGAGHVSLEANPNHRATQFVKVATNVEPFEKVLFKIKYEQLLERKNNVYTHDIHFDPKFVQNAKEFRVDVFIDESRPLAFTRTHLSLGENDVEGDVNNEGLVSVIKDGSENEAHIQYIADSINDDGLSLMTVEYDVDRKGNELDIQVDNGYFVHFYTPPDDLLALPKHVVFVIDVSGSMSGEKLSQTKDAMVAMIDDLKSSDSFNIITFSDETYHYIPQSLEEKVKKLNPSDHDITDVNLFNEIKATKHHKNDALRYVLNLNTIGGTNINDGLIAGLDMAEEMSRNNFDAKRQSIIVFLTDGEATTGVVDGSDIVKNVKNRNIVTEMNVPIYGLAFGQGADFDLIKTISLKNHGFARRIYEGSDATIQLEDFYFQISTPLLKNVIFDYIDRDGVNDSVKFSSQIFNKGSEFVIVGKLPSRPQSVNFSAQTFSGPKSVIWDPCIPEPLPIPVAQSSTSDDVEGDGNKYSKLIDFCIPVDESRQRESTFLERLFAFKTIKSLLKDADEDVEDTDEEAEYEKDATASDTPAIQPSDVPLLSDIESDVLIRPKPDGEIGSIPAPKTTRQKIIDLALKYNFVTPYTSLVVVKPSTSEEESESPVTEETVTVGRYDDFNGAPPLSLSIPASFVSAKFGNFHKRIQHSPSFFGAAPSPPLKSPPQSVKANVLSSPPHQVPATFGFQSLPPIQGVFESLASDDSHMMEDENLINVDDLNCNIILFSGTLSRGKNETLVSDVDDLSQSDVAASLSSLKVVGDEVDLKCCWELFTLKKFRGENSVFHIGETSAHGLGLVFRNLLSAKRVTCP